MRLRVTVGLALLLSGCAAQRLEATMPSASASAVSYDAEDARALHEEAQRLYAEVDRLASAHDCDGACEAGARLCDLAERICAIAARHEGDRELEGRCDDGQNRCASARERLVSDCECTASE